MAAEEVLRVGRRQVRLTHPDKLLFPADGLTKADLAAYHLAVAPAMLPHLRDRPLNLWRYNTGIAGRAIVQQELPRGAPEWVRSVRVPKRGGGSVLHAVANEPATLAWLANQNCVTPHVWTSRSDRLDRPDRLVFDLDPPDDEPGFERIRDAARELGALLRERGLAPFVMTTGSRGLHVVAPLRRTAPTDRVHDAARVLAAALAERRPEALTLEWRKDKREGRILVDTARNGFAQTTVAPYAVRARPGAPVAAPLAWGELEAPGLHAQAWTLATLPARLAATGDPWAAIASQARALPRLSESDRARDRALRDR